ncbi:MAG: radical SAM protein [Deltaproteobacteria bacterium]|nr:radical SAM protein [Deltaproteobacteria bacterium]
MHKTSYLKLYREGTLQDRIDQAVTLMKSCTLCPRECHVDRIHGELGFCHTGETANVASLHAHFGEEAPLVGNSGSGTIFFRSCNLLCSFCQNYDISHDPEGGESSPKELAVMMLSLQRRGCHNINFVTPTHVVPQILEGLTIAIEHGLRVPLVYNTGGYDSVDTLRILEGIFDIYMPDFKFWDATWAEKFCKAPDYRKIAVTAIKEMHRQVGDLALDEDGIAVRGLLVRHLVLPEDAAGTAEVVRFLSEEISPNTYLNVMAQFRPEYNASRFPELNRPITRQEYADALRLASRAGLARGLAML